ncbi:MAG: 1-(5-phosphoribosyl)-5-[(5-phosphoribosylamino)methylideneamino]imidazole-4-carboxamide isomerase [Crocinitomicaceae bacterium]|nr:1-(5-phosphoribosyl)-5-[(5-phosphoribosylamino)methylideneamino]imidazole-4-carboxamide isomerase [Crocinitomicaceae bacterium]
MRIIPAIDIIDAKCVRLTKGDYSTKKVYSEDPLDIAKQFEDAGVKYLHLVDLDGAKAKRIINYKVLEEIASKTSLSVDFGGGLKSDEDLKIAFESGAKQITGGSIAVKNPELFKTWIGKYGPEKIILGADARNGFISTSGWQEDSDLKIESFIKTYLDLGLEYVISTDISKDGMLEGPSVDLYKNLIGQAEENKQKLNLIASGGVATLDDLTELRAIDCEGAIVGKAIYENRISLKDLEKFIVNG